MTTPMQKSLASLSRLESILILGFSFFIIPLSYVPNPIDPGLSLRFCLLSVLIAALAIVRLARLARAPRDRFPGAPTPISLCCTLYFFTCLLSIIPSINKSESVFEIAKVFLFCNVVWFVSSSMRRGFAHLHSIARAAAVSALVIASIGILEYWGVIRFLATDYVVPGATMINKNLLSSYLFLCLGFSLFAAICSRSRAWRILGFAAYAAILYVLLATQTRAVWLGAIGGFTSAIALLFLLQFSFLSSLAHTGKKAIIALILIPLIMVAVVSILRPAASTLPSLATRASTIVDPKFESNNQRIILWRKTLRMARDFPLLGAGAGTWKILLPRYGIGDLLWPELYSIEVRPYNDFLWILSENGIFGLLFYAGFFLVSAVYCLRALRTGQNPTTVAGAALLLFTIAGFAIISFFDFPKERIEHLTLFGVLIAACTSLGADREKISFTSNSASQWPRYAALAILFTGSIACLWIGINRLSGDIHDAVMRDHWKRQEWKEAITEADRAASPLYTMDPTSTPLRWYRGVANFRLGHIDLALQDYLLARDNHPWHLHVLNDLGTCYSLKGNQPRAKACYYEALAISPFFEATLINLAVIYYNNGQYDSAYCIISRSKSPHYDPRFESFNTMISRKVTNPQCP
jgi:O-antigen ligase